MDGACFGPGLPHLFLMVYPEFLPTNNRDMSKTFIRKLTQLKEEGHLEEFDAQPLNTLPLELPGLAGLTAADEEDPDPAVLQFGETERLGGQNGFGAVARPTGMDSELAEEKRKEIERQRLINRHAKKVQGIYQPSVDAVHILRRKLYGPAWDEQRAAEIFSTDFTSGYAARNPQAANNTVSPQEQQNPPHS